MVAITGTAAVVTGGQQRFPKAAATEQHLDGGRLQRRGQPRRNDPDRCRRDQLGGEGPPSGQDVSPPRRARRALPLVGLVWRSWEV